MLDAHDEDIRARIDGISVHVLKLRFFCLGVAVIEHGSPQVLNHVGIVDINEGGDVGLFGTFDAFGRREVEEGRIQRFPGILRRLRF